MGMISTVVAVVIHTWPEYDDESGDGLGRIIRLGKLLNTKEKLMKKGSTKLTKNLKAELKALEALPDKYIDTADASENLDCSNAERGVFYRPVKQ